MPLNKNLRSLWLDAGYPEGMGSSTVVPPPPSSLLRVYHLTSATHAINSIAMRRLKVSRFSDLNDPYEAMGVMWRRIELRSRIKAIRDKWDNQLGLLCFSSNWTNPVLWSHYGDKHKGVCLGFDVPRPSAKEVRYRPDRIDIKVADLDRLESETEAPEEVLLTKFKHWEYESERRVLLNLRDCVEEGSLYFSSFSPSLALTEVILGDLCPLDQNAVRSLSAALPAPPVVFRARLAGKSYGVVPDGESV